MPTTYSANPANAPATYTLPSDLDDATAESVNVVFRALADNLVGLTALLNQQNTFTAAPLEVDVNDSETAALVTRRTTDDDSHSGNVWKAVMGFALGGGGGSYVNIYAGKIGGPQQFAIVLNAVWDTSTQTWSKDNTGADSIALLMSLTGSVQISKKPAGSGTWSTWPTNSGVINVNSFVGADVTASDVVSAVNGFFTPGSTGDFTYAPVKIRLPIAVPLGDGSNNFVIATGSEYGAKTGSSGVQQYPLRFPENCGGATVEIMFKQSSAATSFFEVTKYTSDWTAKTISSTSVDSGTTPAASGVNTLTLNVSTIIAGAEYRLRWAPGATADLLFAVRVTSMLDNGPRNTF